MPFYAEVGVSAEIQSPLVVDHRLKQPIAEVLSPNTAAMEMVVVNPSRYAQLAQLPQSLLELLSGWLDQETRDRLAYDPEMIKQVITGVLQKLAELGQGEQNVNPNDPELVCHLIEEAFRAYLKDHPELSLAPTTIIKWAHPLGVLATDHVGYLSFDLTRLPSDVYEALVAALHARRLDPTVTTDTSIWLYVMGQEQTCFDALAQGGFANDAIVVKLELDIPDLPAEFNNLGILAMQNPNLTDWKLSPVSFAANPTALLGEDGCENIFPANVALQEYYFYQVVSLSDIDIKSLNIPDDATVKLGIVNEYRLAWYPLGHSLGQIQYTLPLAPGESVNLAVIDWTRKDVGERSEFTKETEQLQHNQQRDRTITETVQAAIKEHQNGSSFMWGSALSAGAAGTVGAAGLAAGLTGSLGGSSSDSHGSRDIAGSTVQKLSDNISQASAAMRELQSTVVVQTMSQEKEAIETRTVVNYNHSHSLTILYYEVLRHFRVVTEFVRHRPIVLVKIKDDLLNNPTEQDIHENRTALQSALIDQSLIDAFASLDRIRLRKETVKVTNPQSESLPAIETQPSPDKVVLREHKFIFFRFEMFSGGMIAQWDQKDHGGERIIVNAKIRGRYEVTDKPGDRVITKSFSYDFIDLNTDEGLTGWNQFRFPDACNKFYVTLPEDAIPIAWEDITAVEIGITPPNTYASFKHIKITGINEDGGNHVLVDENYDQGHLLIRDARSFLIPIIRPPKAESPKPPSRPIEEVQDEVKYNQLLSHIKYHKAHYSRAIYLNQNPVERANQLNEFKLKDKTTVLDKVENRPLEMVGDYVAYPCLNGKWSQTIKAEMEAAMKENSQSEPVPDERLVTLPTRGLFAEAKLGHCNASEEIDNTRFWKWDEHAIPHMAPDIAAIQAGQHQLKDMALQPTPFPQSMVNIVNPPAAPDPTGLAAAMNVLATPNIFRDMSGRAEVSDLLKKLSDNTISIADAANKAKELQNRFDENIDKQQKDYDLGQAQNDTELAKAWLDFKKAEANKVTPQEAQDAIKLSESEMKKGNKTSAEHQETSKNLQGNIKGAISPQKKEPATRSISFSFTYMKGKPMFGAHHIKLTDTASKKIYESKGNAIAGVSINESIITMNIDSSVKEVIINADSIVGPPIDYSALLNPEQIPKSPSKNITYHFSGQEVLFIDGINTITISGGSSVHEIEATSKQDLNEKISAKLSAKGSLKEVLDISPSIGKDRTSSSGSEEKIKYSVTFLDSSIGLDIKVASKPEPKK
ncbi:hypothetical protein A1507_21575 [Methylomonas koyamae]|uniref:Uncharacterized protein n=2 Tax=Methylomonas koyamae TaxID=702114 RepID=A0A177MZ03_9GAMM|nr:hypothetical protein A1507_21575 [Methylomonas koyamae]